MRITADLAKVGTHHRLTIHSPDERYQLNAQKHRIAKYRRHTGGIVCHDRPCGCPCGGGKGAKDRGEEKEHAHDAVCAASANMPVHQYQLPRFPGSLGPDKAKSTQGSGQEGVLNVLPSP